MSTPLHSSKHALMGGLSVQKRVALPEVNVVVLAIEDDADTVFTYDKRTSWWMIRPEEREATMIECALLDLIKHAEARK